MGKGLAAALCGAAMLAGCGGVDMSTLVTGGQNDYVVFFDFDRDEIRPDAEETLEQVIARADELGTCDVTIIGHTDTVGSVEYNQDLSERRANAVYDWLYREGMDPVIASTDARSELDPAVDTGDQVREQANRRVEITFGDERFLTDCIRRNRDWYEPDDNEPRRYEPN
ncbi:MAG: OmpA family protein [Rubricella sp.]